MDNNHNILIEEDIIIDDIDIDDIKIDGVDLSNIELDEDNISSKFELKIERDKKWDRKLYIDYLGLNPLTIVKEDKNVLTRLLNEVRDITRLSYLVNNLIQFRENMIQKFNSESFTDEELDLAKKIINDYDIKLDIMKSLVDMDTSDIIDMDIGDLEMNEKYDILESLSLRDKSNLLLNNLANDKLPIDKVIKFADNIYKKLLIYTSVSDYKNNQSGKKNSSENDYANRTYKYSTLEIAVFTKLDFPTALMGFENIIKKNITIKNDSLKFIEFTLSNKNLRNTLVALQTYVDYKTQNKQIINYL